LLLASQAEHIHNLFIFLNYSFTMEHIIIDWTYTILGSIVAVIGGAIGLKLASTRSNSISRQSFNDQLSILVDENKQLKTYLKSVKGTIAQMKQGLVLPQGTNIEEMDHNGFDGVIKGLIGKYSSMCPPQFRPLLQDPTIINFLLEEAKKHPEQTKEVLKHFISSNGSVNESSDGTESKKSLEDIPTTGA